MLLFVYHWQRRGGVGCRLLPYPTRQPVKFHYPHLYLCAANTLLIICANDIHSTRFYLTIQIFLYNNDSCAHLMQEHPRRAMLSLGCTTHSAITSNNCFSINVADGISSLLSFFALGPVTSKKNCIRSGSSSFIQTLYEIFKKNHSP